MMRKRAKKKPVERDINRFKLFTNSRPRLPSGYSADVRPQTTRELINQRRALDWAGYD